MPLNFQRIAFAAWQPANNRWGVRERPACPRRGSGRECVPAALDRALLGGRSTLTVKFHMKRLSLLLLLLWSFPALAKQCGDPAAKHWSTVVNLAAGPVTLHWTGVGEGRQAVCRLSYRNRLGEVQALEVWGEPEVNVTENLVAFTSCADDGCNNTILVADILQGVVLKGDLPPSTQQSYFSLKWTASGRTLSVEGESIGGRPPRHFTCRVTERVICATGGI